MLDKQQFISLTIQSDGDLLSAIKHLDEGGMGVLFVVDSLGRLNGMITDGDIRKAMINGIQLNDPLSVAMNTNFSYGLDGQSHQASLNQLRHLRRSHLPIIDKEGYLKDVVLLEADFFVCNDTPVVLMVGGLGSRLGELTKNTPKPMLPIGEIPILESILRSFIDNGFEEFYFAVNYKSHVIEDYFGDGSRWDISINYLREDKRLGTAGALTLLPERPKNSFIVMNGDVLTDINFENILRYHTESNSSATMAIRRYEIQVPFGVVELQDYRISRIVEKPIHDFYVNAGIYILNPDCLDLIPEDSFFDMPELFNALLNKSEAPSTYLIHEYWKDIGHKQDYADARSELDGRNKG